jgi:hypothetical protein
VSVVRNAVQGAVAGAVATLAMDVVWYRRYRSAAGDKGFAEWEFSTDAAGFGEDAPAPARVGKRVADLVGIELADSSVAPTNNVVHWMTGIGWGKLAGLAAAVVPVAPVAVGAATGVTAWATSYAALGRIGVYKPIREYDKQTLWKDLSAHLVFGTTMGVVLSVARQ